MSDPVEPTTDDLEKAIEALDLAGIDHPFAAMNALIALDWAPAFRWHCSVEGCHLADGPMHTHTEFDAGEWAEGIAFERDHQRAKGYTAEHDDQHGIDHLLMLAQDYARRGRVFESAAMVEAARELWLRALAGKPEGLHHSTQCYLGQHEECVGCGCDCHDPAGKPVAPSAGNVEKVLIEALNKAGRTRQWNKDSPGLRGVAEALRASDLWAGKPVVIREALGSVIRDTRFIATPRLEHGFAKPVPEEVDRLLDALLASGPFEAREAVQAVDPEPWLNMATGDRYPNDGRVGFRRFDPRPEYSQNPADYGLEPAHD